MSFDDYRRRDYRIKCAKCRKWMRFVPTENSPATRRPAPFAGLCTGCRVPWSLKERARAYERSKAGRMSLRELQDAMLEQPDLP